MNNLGRLIEVIPNAVFGGDKHRLINEAPYVLLVTDSPVEIDPVYDFEIVGNMAWSKHRVDAIKDNKDVDLESLFKGNTKNFKLAFFDKPFDIENGNALDALYNSKVILRGWEYFDDNIVKLVVLRNLITHNTLSEHLVYMDQAQP